ncbi:enoyl-CoA hydratase [Actinomadura algeriensis]|uniref:Enoyl-CoA hydratase n=1 Tax=Actinomadura algeriensis TaxID=1679523 RepID=A0ABR9JZ80_9ACTN|nr:enoyl-CoA hydratase [Actinomadura algeriensis]MBE1535887.1 enoyl-CoA hydratase [Actinomadura algeriensis]
MNDEAVITHTGDGIATITLNRPAARNAITVDMLRRVRAAMTAADADPEVGAVVLTGADPAFCAGLDLKELGGSGPRIKLSGAEPGGDGPGGDAHCPWRPIGKPIVGAVNGPAVTGGLEFALHCDILLASERAVFADTHARVGVMPGWGLSVLLPRAVGRGMARRMSLTGEFVDARTALRCGLVTEVTAHDRLPGRAREVAAAIAGNDREAVTTLLASYRAIELEETAGGLAREAATTREWAAAGVDRAAGASRRREEVVRANRRGLDTNAGENRA